MSDAALVATLIVRDEERLLAGCLASLAGLVDDVVVYDTGSVDGTVALARAAGARVVEGFWDDDFARARNACLAEAGTGWALVLDADERAHGDAAALRARLADAVHGEAPVVALRVRVDNVGTQGAYSHPSVRLFRAAAVRYAGRVHEQVVAVGGRPLETPDLDPATLRVEHLGYADPTAVRAKAERNVALAETALADVEDSRRPAALLDLGRALVGAQRRQEAVDAFETVRALAPATTSVWQQATDHLARLLLAAGMDDVALLLAEQLRAAGADPRWCDWLAAQALAQLGEPGHALTLLAGVNALVDPAGRRYSPARLEEMRGLIARLAAAHL